MAKIDELHNYAYPDKYLDELHIYDKSIGNSGFDEVHNYGNRGVTYGMDELHLYGSYQTVEDEINTPASKEREIIDIDEYFDEIEELDEEQRQERKDLANEFKEILKLIFALFLADLRLGNPINEGFYHSLAKSRLMDAIDTKMPHLSATIYVEIEKYIDQNLNLVIESTLRHTDDAYYFSEARATAIAVDDAMATVNLEELDEAIKAGYKYKVWVTMRDKKVRHTHEIADSQKVKIEKPFKVGRCLMQAPMVFDEESDYQDGKEVINCRCFLIYSNRGGSKTDTDNDSKEKGYTGEQVNRIGDNSVNLSFINSQEYRNLFDKLSSDPELNQAIYERAKKILTDNNGTDTETTIVFSNKKVIVNQTGTKDGLETTLSKPQREIVKNSKNKVGLHNHPTNMPPTGSDFTAAGSRGYDFGVAATHDGRLFKYSTGDKFFTAHHLDAVVDKYINEPYNLSAEQAHIRALNEFQKDYGISWQEIK